jgi:iron complex outermembrane recepter protein
MTLNTTPELRRAGKIALLLGGCMAATVAVLPAAAQDLVLDEIIITAQKRPEPLQRVPAAVTVLTGAALENGAAYNVEGLQSLIPTLNFRKGGTSLNSSLFLRGVGTINFSIAAEPSVAFVLDGVVLARAGEAFGDLYDIERIEVLRGPQGTLFGKNASAGAVNIVTKRPGNKLAGEFSASAFQGNEYKAKLAVDVPLSDKVRSRVTAFNSTYDGNITNLYQPNPGSQTEKINGYDRQGIRALTEIDVSEKTLVTLIADYRKADDNCCAEVIGRFPAANANVAAATSLLSGVVLQEDQTRSVRHDLVTQTREEAWGLSAQIDHEIGDYTLTSITSYRAWDNREIREGDWLDRPAAYVGNPFARLHDDGPQESGTFTQELRVTSPPSDVFEYVAGLYYYNADADRVFTRNVQVCSSSTLAIDATGQRPCLPGASTYTNGSSTASFGSVFENMAAFGQGTYTITDELKAIVGLRFTHDYLEYYHDRVPSPVALPGLRTDRSGFKDKTDNNNLSGKIGLQYQFDRDVMGYASFSRGYKGPAYNVFFNMNTTGLNVIDEELADAYEIGFKSSLFGNHLILNTALFYTEYSGFQANNFDLLNGVVVTRLTNAGEVSTKGVEFDWTYRSGTGLTITGGVAYTDAQIEKFNTPAGAVATVLPGQPLALAPKWKGTLNADYVWDSESLPVSVYFGAQYAYTSDQYSDIGQNPLLKIESYSTVDASIGISDKDDKYRLTLVAKNLFDESFASLITPGGPAGSLRYLIPREADRYIGVTGRVRFGE